MGEVKSPFEELFKEWSAGMKFAVVRSSEGKEFVSISQWSKKKEKYNFVFFTADRLHAVITKLIQLEEHRVPSLKV